MVVWARRLGPAPTSPHGPGHGDWQIFSPNAVNGVWVRTGVGYSRQTGPDAGSSGLKARALSLGGAVDAVVNVELEHMWSRVQNELHGAVGEAMYRIWLEPLTAVELADGRLVVYGPAQACDWVRRRFGPVLQASIDTVLGEQTVVELLPEPSVAGEAGGNLDGSIRRDSRARESGGAAAGGPQICPDRHHAHRGRAGEAERGSGQEPRGGALGNPKLTFDQFVIGGCNRLAHGAALAVAEMPGQAYNPLFICGPPGVGKTHLLGSIARLLLSHEPGLAIRCTTGEEFTNDFLGALAGRRTDAFKAEHRQIDVLLVDDVQFLERKAKTEEEFFHTFNALYDSGRQLVLSSDRPPRDLQALEDRLRERFESGLVADIAPPDPATRLAILRKRADHDGLRLADDSALELIAERVTDNIRAIEGALIRVVAYSSLTGRPLTVELTRELLDGLYPTSTDPQAEQPPGRRTGAPTIADIKAAICQRYGLTADELVSKSRVSRLAWPRQMAIYLARELTNESLPSIGKQFGGRDHTTVMHAHRRAVSRIADDQGSRAAVQNLLTDLNIDT
jgi:chromosomal replication initiator protein